MVRQATASIVNTDLHTSDLILAGLWIEAVWNLVHFYGMAFPVPDDNGFNKAVCVGALGREGLDRSVVRA